MSDREAPPIESLSPDGGKRVAEALQRVRALVNAMQARPPQSREEGVGVVYELRAALAECLAAMAADELHVHRLRRAAQKKAGNGGT